MTNGCASGAVLRLIVRPHLERSGFHLDRFDTWFDGESITTSRQPLLDGARVLLGRGFDADAMLTMRHAGREYDSFRPQAIGELARWTIKERDRSGLRRERWQPLGDAPASHPVASSRGNDTFADSQVAAGARRRSGRAPAKRNGMIIEGAARKAFSWRRWA